MGVNPMALLGQEGAQKDYYYYYYYYPVLPPECDGGVGMNIVCLCLC
jgi:hypothetical protein